METSEGKAGLKVGEGRYHRQELLEEWDQELIRNSTVLVVGVGALGSVVALDLALMGIGKLVLIDNDTVELSNLNRQILFREEDIGRSKVEAAKEFLEKLNPEVEINAYMNDMRSVDKEVYQTSSAIVEGLDTFEARRWLNSMCVHLNKPLIHGGLFGWWGNVQVIIPFETPCLECQPLIPKERLQKACTLPGEARREKEQEKEIFPMISTTTTVIGGIQAQEALKIILKRKDLLDNYLFYDGLSQSFTKIRLVRNPSCVVCSPKYRTIGVKYVVSLEEPIQELKNRLIMTYGLQNPKIIIEGKIVPDDTVLKDAGVKEGDPIFVNDKNLASPIKLIVVIR